MNKTIRRLAAAAAAASALSLIPLAEGASAAPPAAASARLQSDTTLNWAGYYTTRPGPQTLNGQRYQPRVDGATVSFTVPAGQRAGSVGKPVYEGAMWAGVGGIAQAHRQIETLEQAGVVEVAGKTGPQRYLIFWEMYPFNSEQNFGGHPVYVKPGDKITVLIEPPWFSGGGWWFSVTVNDKQYSQHVPAGRYHTDEPTTAEVITEWAGGHAGIGPQGIAGHLIYGMPNTGTVHYTYAGAIMGFAPKPDSVSITQHSDIMAHTVRVWQHGHWVNQQRILVFPTAARPSDQYSSARNAFNTIYTGSW